MLDTEKEKRQRAVKIAKAINSIEGVPIPDETNEFFQQWIDSEISDDQLTEVMLSLCKRIESRGRRPCRWWRCWSVLTAWIPW